MQSNSHCNYFEWVNEEESKFEGKESEIEANSRKIVEEDEVCLDRGESYLGIDKEKWEVEEEIAKREKIREIPAIFISYVVGVYSCICGYVLVEGEL